MKKRLLALALCVMMIVPLFASCGEINLEYKGPILQMYLTEQVYDFDPLNSFNNESQQKIVSMLYAGLFKINDRGDLEPELVQHVEIKDDDNIKEYKMTLTLKETYWSDGTMLSADDVAYAFRRALRIETSNEAASLLMDIKNAEEIKHGDASIDDLGVSAIDTLVLEITFKQKIDFEQFKLNLASPALVPLRENVVEKNVDWAKKPVTAVFSGPFILRKVSYEDLDRGLTLERNSYYFRHKTKDAVDKSVTPYRIIVDYTKTAEEQLDLYNAGQVLYVGDIALSLRNDYKDKATVSNALSTHTYYLNQNALIASKKAGEENGFALFAIKEVRQALSLAIDRNAIRDLVVFADVATGLVPNGIFNENGKNVSFRSKATENLIAGEADVNAAKNLLQTAGINAADYTFSISVRENDVVHNAIAEAVAKVWTEQLNFNVSVKKVGVEGKAPNEVDETGEVQKDIRDDLFNESLAKGDFEVVALDLVGSSVTPLSFLAPFALNYTGNSLDMSSGLDDYPLTPHKTGYNSEEYNAIIDNVYSSTAVSKRAELLHEAENLLLEDMPVIPIIFNKDAYLASGDLRGFSSTYFGTRNFAKASYRDWENYGLNYGFIEKEEETPAETEAPTAE